MLHGNVIISNFIMFLIMSKITKLLILCSTCPYVELFICTPPFYMFLASVRSHVQEIEAINKQ